MTGIAVLITIAIAYVTAKRRWVQSFIALCSLAVVLFFFRHEILRAKGIRLTMWATYLDYWLAKSPWGIGPGAFEIYGPTIGITVPGTYSYSTAWVHNDWIQILIEYGPLGFLLFSGFFIWCLVKSFDKPLIFSGLMGFGTCMFFYSPLHFLVSQVLFCIYATLAFDSERGFNGQEKSEKESF